MKITLTSIPVLDQLKAKKFYTEVLDFVVKHNIDLGGGNLWLTLVSAEDTEGPELLLEPAPVHFPPSKTYQEALFKAGIPCTQFESEDIEEEYHKIKGRGGEFTTIPTTMGNVKIAVFDDTCGNLIQLVEQIS